MFRCYNHTNEINITDDVKIVMNYPTIKDVDMRRTIEFLTLR